MKLENILKIVPKHGPEGDLLYNRRLLAFYGLIFTVYWNHVVLAVYFILALGGKASDAALVALLGVPGTLAGLGFWKYLKAAEKEDESKNNSGTTDTVIVQPIVVEGGQSEKRSEDKNN